MSVLISRPDLRLCRTARPLSLPLVVIVLALSRPVSGGMMPVDLELDRALVKEILMVSGPNPHEAFPCDRCHQESPGKTNVPYEVAKKYGLEIPLITEGDSTVLLCEQCHTGENHFMHPVRFKVERLKDIIEQSELFSLQTIVEGYDKLTCLTCHDIHFPHTRDRLLRGFDVGPQPSEGSFSSRIDFCRACHGEEVRVISAHWGGTPDDKCNLCHLGYREPGVPGPLKRHFNKSCAICHPLPRGKRPHFYSYNPFPDFGRNELEGYGLRLSKEGFTCTTCHSHHRPAVPGTFLRPAFISVISKSLRVNPHRTTRFCRNCHPFKPPPIGTPHAVAPVWEEDVTRLCRGCHGKEEALGMSHPLAVPRNPDVIPEGWKLRKDGSLGCQTCHLSGHGPYDPENPKMLRGGYYRERNDICFKCHDRDEYINRNIHMEVAQFKGCEFCHAVEDRTALRPEGKTGKLLAEPLFLCLPCHSPLPHPASADHTGKPQSRSFVSINEEVTPLTMGKITCHTCHDSHSTRAEVRYLRKSDANALICRHCHAF